MQCHVLLFAQLAEAAGSRRLTIELPDGATVGDAIDALAATHPAVAPLSEQLAAAVDEHYVSRDTVLCDGRRLALIPPVSGG